MINMKTFISLILSLLFIPSVLAAQPLPEESRVPGGIALIPLEGLNGKNPPSAWYKGNRVMVIPSIDTHFTENSPWLAVIGIPLSAKADKQQLMKADGKSFPFSIIDKEYKAQYLTIKNKRHVEPDPEDIKRWRREKAKMVKAFTHWSQPQQPVTNFQLPAKGPYSSPFGLKRFFNKQPRNPHSGLDIAAPHGAPITSPSVATVVDTGNYFFNGNTVILDHGHGLTTMYCHMSRIDVKVGDKIETGHILGAIGKTGRVTGPHLHWSVSLNNTRIDPTLMLAK